MQYGYLRTDYQHDRKTNGRYKKLRRKENRRNKNMKGERKM